MDFAGAISDARLLIAHAARSGAPISAADATAVADFEQAVAASTVTTQTEVAFWAGMTNIAKAVQPVTVASLKANEVHDGAGSNGRVKAQTAVHRYRRWALGTLVVLVLAQIYTLIGSTLADDVDRLNKQIEDLRSSIPAPVPQMNVESATLDKQLQFATLTNLIDTTYDMLLLWNLAWRIPAKPIARVLRPLLPDDAVAAAGAPGESADPAAVQVAQELAARKARLLARMEARFAVSSLTAYILPGLYGLLGTCVFILRNLASKIESVSFASDVAYQLRLPLGALAGVAMAFVPAGTMGTGESALPHLTLAFIAGYSVEVLFSVMDRFISSFTGASSPARA